MSLATLRTKQKKEVDFAVVENGEVKEMVEVKLKEAVLSDGLAYFVEKNQFKGVQVVRDLKHTRRISDQLEIVRAEEYLEKLIV